VRRHFSEASCHVQHYDTVVLQALLGALDLGASFLHITGVDKNLREHFVMFVD